MPGTGHSARYKGSISNRVKISPFQRLAEWNAQLLGADGAVPSIVGGGSLAFKKLDASDIEGVMHNPTKNTLQFTNSAGIMSDGALKITTTLGLTIGKANDKIGFFGQDPIQQDSSGNTNTLTKLNAYLVRLGLLS